MSTPWRSALLLWGAVLALAVGTGLLLGLVAPSLDGTQRALVGVVVLTAFALLIARGGWTWTELGVTLREVGRARGLLAVLLLVALAPLCLGVRSVGAGELSVLVAGYALTGVTEELLWRGVALRILTPLGANRAVVIAAALFGAVHLANVVYRDNLVLVLAQVWGAFCFGLAYGAVRRRLTSIVPLMALHALTDLAAAVGAVPKIPVLVGEDTILLVLGIWLLRRQRAEERLLDALRIGRTGHEDAVATPAGTPERA